MDLISEHGMQLGAALIGVVLMFVAAYALPERVTITLVVLLIPFQLIQSRYGTVNVGIAYLVFVAFLLQGRIRRLPYLTPVVLIFFAYLLSTATSLSSTYVQQLLYIINVGANFAVFYLIFNHFYRVPDPRYAIRLLLWVNVLVLIFNLAQLALGFSSVSVLGVSEWTLGGNLEDKRRLLGPFGTAGINASYLVLQTLLCAYAFLRMPGGVERVLIVTVALGNFAFLVATGSRGGFLSLLFGVAVFALVLRRQLGLARIVISLLIGGAAMSVVAVLVVTLTPFDVLFTRLMGTEFEGVVPDSRKGWYEIVERIPERLVFGHGPRIVLPDMSPRFLREVFVGFPHNLYLFLLYSLGMVGLIAWMSWFCALTLHWWGIARRQWQQSVAAELPRLGVVLMIAFLFDQMKIEFLRFEVLDFQQYMFTTWGIFAAFAIGLRERARRVSPADVLPSNGQMAPLAGVAPSPGRSGGGLPAPSTPGFARLAALRADMAATDAVYAGAIPVPTDGNKPTLRGSAVVGRSPGGAGHPETGPASQQRRP
jgi:O-antigen ligase